MSYTQMCIAHVSQGRVGRGIVSQKPSVSLILNYESVDISTTAKEAFLLTAALGSKDHRHPHSLQWQHGIQT